LAGRATVADNLRRFAQELGAILERLVPLVASAFSDCEESAQHPQAVSTWACPSGQGTS